MQLGELVSACEAVGGGDLGAVEGDREQQAGVHAPAVDQHGTGPALAVVAALLRGRVPQVITQCVEQGGARVEGQSALLTVDDKVHWMTHRAPPSARGREVESRVDERGWLPSQAASRSVEHTSELQSRGHLV